ncbi:hypothetical protein MJD09_22240, partial [bacterium]|nr:hypothetical protein [bacterium]
MKKRILALATPFLCYLFVVIPSGYGQSQFETLENRFLAHINSFRSQPSTLNRAEVQRTINDIQSHVSTSNLAAIEQFTLPYYQGYLYYIAGQHERDEALLDRAIGRFREAVRAYQPEVRLPDKRAFATYMQAWCSLRKYLISPAPNDFRPLLSASQ